MQKKKCCQSLLTIERLEGIFCITPIYKIQHNFLFFANTFVQCIQEILSNFLFIFSALGIITLNDWNLNIIRFLIIHKNYKFYLCIFSFSIMFMLDKNLEHYVNHFHNFLGLLETKKKFLEDTR